ncbi:MAG: hypothetical protein PVJ57_09425 [Phycisphaerae bacterium]|jgi:hypothetical protein
MADAVEREVLCPRCRYCLRGLAEPRCPECGFQFTAEEYASGMLRENIPTWLDRADLWQPHQVLIRSLAVLAFGSVSATRLLKRLDVNGPLSAAILMAVVGTLWNCLAAAALLAVAVAVWTGASPAAAARCALYVWTPRFVGTILLSAAGAMPLLTLPEVLHVARPSWHQRLRAWLYMLPMLTAKGIRPSVVLLLLVPHFAVGVPFAWPAVPLIHALLLWRTFARTQVTNTAPTFGVLAIALVCTLAAMALAGWSLPESLEPPWWIYFP